MITQTLEWHRFGDEMPELGKECLLIPVNSADPVVVSELTIKAMEPRWNDTWFLMSDDDLWAYWSEPKEEK